MRGCFNVPFSYAVEFTHGVFSPKNSLLARLLKPAVRGTAARVFVVIDAGVAAALPSLVTAVKAYAACHATRMTLAAEPVCVPGGEGVKNAWDVMKDLLRQAGTAHLDRQSYMIVVGGGSVLDMAGMVAALIHRGVRLIRIPTTVLGQNDAGVGVKNGMDVAGFKNFIGTFAPPVAVIDDFDFLRSLSDEAWRAGIAEAFKVAAIKDVAFLRALIRSAPALRRREMAPMERLIRTTARLHVEHIASHGDPFERGVARPLDFGHWSAHRLESMSGYSLCHGYAVSIGVALDSTIAMLKGLISPADCEALIGGLEACGLPVDSPLLDETQTLLVGLEQFREHLGGRLTITLPRPLGKSVEVHALPEALVVRAVSALRARGVANEACAR